eukprot:scaffold2064_cov140-Skeletonema_dohrnii-CCMP3373.AAC.1
MDGEGRRRREGEGGPLNLAQSSGLVKKIHAERREFCVAVPKLCGLNLCIDASNTPRQDCDSELLMSKGSESLTVL